jgi:signal transduction histidine kinase
MARSSLATRLVAAAAVWCALLLSAGGYGLSTLFSDSVESSFDARLGVLLEGIVAGSELDQDGKLKLGLQLGEPRFDQPFSGWYWQINDGDQALRRSSSLWVQALDLAPAKGREGAVEIIGPDEREVRLLVRPITLPGREAPFLYAVAGDGGEVRTQVQRFNQVLATALGISFIGVLVAILVQVRFGLEPLRRIRRALTAIRAGESRRLEGDYPTEIDPLVHELNALIDHSETLIERAQTHVGNLAHGLKTPLSVLANEARKVDGPLGQMVDRQTRLMREQVEHHLARARAAATSSILGGRTELAPVLEDLRRTLVRIHAERAIAIEVVCAKQLAFRGARHDLEEMLGNLMDNACKWAAAAVRVEAAQRDSRLIIQVEDDGPGLPAAAREEALKRGYRLDETVPGSGLGLSIVVDLAKLYGGRLEFTDADLGGLGVRLTLPAATGERLNKS